MILNNYPGFTHLEVGHGNNDNFPTPGNDWGIVGREIGNNRCNKSYQCTIGVP